MIVITWDPEERLSRFVKARIEGIMEAYQLRTFSNRRGKAMVSKTWLTRRMGDRERFGMCEMMLWRSSVGRLSILPLSSTRKERSLDLNAWMKC